MSKRVTKDDILKAKGNQIGALRDLPSVGENILPYEPGSFLQGQNGCWLVVDAEVLPNGIEARYTTIRFDPKRVPRHAKIYQRGFVSFKEMGALRERLLARKKQSARATDRRKN